MHFLTYVDINYFLLSTYEELIPEVMSCSFKHTVLYEISLLLRFSGISLHYITLKA
jgi:hypothetical protein